MKKILFWGLLALIFTITSTPVIADSLVVTTDINYTNPQYVTPSDPTTEEVWLEHLLGFDVSFLSKDEDGNLFDTVPDNWEYAVLKYGVGAPPAVNHWALLDDGDLIVEPADIIGIPSRGLSHISYFSAGNTNQVPEPTILLLLGTGLIGLGVAARRKMEK